jgi:hypothetical protein
MFTVELMRRNLAPKVGEVNWDVTFQQADTVISRELEHIRTLSRQPDVLRAALDEDHKAFVAVFEKSLGAKGNVSIIVPKSAARHQVTVTTNPQGGLRFYLTVLQYELLKSSGGLDDEANWNEITTQKVTLGGDFHFRGRWSERIRITGVVAIDADQEVTISEGN